MHVHFTHTPIKKHKLSLSSALQTRPASATVMSAKDAANAASRAAIAKLVATAKPKLVPAVDLNNKSTIPIKWACDGGERKGCK